MVFGRLYCHVMGQLLPGSAAASTGGKGFMRIRLLMWLLVILSLAACNLGNEPEETIATDIPISVPAGKPQVTITSPQDGDEFAVNEQILISVNATDSVGVTGIQLVANGAIVKRVSSDTTEGYKNYPAVLDYTPRAAGEVQMQVIAFRGSTASDPAALTIEVVSETSSGSGTGSSGSGNSGSGSSGSVGSGPVRPTIPNDGVCRALTTTNLNLRSQPTTSAGNNVVTVLPTFTLTNVIGRLGDNSWWQVQYSTISGWVSAQFTELSGNCQNVPVQTTPLPPTPTPTPRPATPTPTLTPTITNTPAAVKPDLLVTNIGGSQTVTLAGSPVTLTYSVTVTNIGAGAAGQFTVKLFVNNTEQEDWVVSGLDRGQSVALTTELTWSAAGTYDIRVNADTANQVEELSDVNNRGDMTVTVSGS